MLGWLKPRMRGQSVNWPREDCLMGQICKTGCPREGAIRVLSSVETPAFCSRLGPGEGGSQQREDVLPPGAVIRGETAWPVQR